MPATMINKNFLRLQQLLTDISGEMLMERKKNALIC